MRFVLAIDYDGTLVFDTPHDHGNGCCIMPCFREDILAKAKEFCAHPHCDVILWTCREERLLVEAIDMCEEAGLTFDAVNMNTQETLEWNKLRFGRYGNTCGRKIFADLYVDDRSPGSIPYFLTLNPQTEWLKVKDRNTSK